MTFHSAFTCLEMFTEYRLAVILERIPAAWPVEMTTMTTQPHPYVYFLGISTLVSAAVGVLALLRRRSPGMRSLVMICGLLVSWSFFYALTWLYAGSEWSHIWFYAMYLGVAGVPLAFLVLVLDAIQQLRWLTPGRLALLLLEPVLMVLAVWTNDLHHLFVTRFAFSHIGGLVYLEIQRGPIYWVNVVYSYLLLLVSMALLVRRLNHNAPLFRWQITACIIGASLPWLGNIATLSGLVPLHVLDITPVTFGITAIVFYFALSSRARYNLLPTARGMLLEILSDGLLVLDTNFRFLVVNPAAERLLGMEARDLIGREAGEVFPHWHRLAALLDPPREYSAQAQGQHNPSLYLDLKVTPITNKGRVTGWLVLFRDITDRWQVEQQMLKANQELKARLTEIESLQQELRAQAIRDPLTNLYNRRYLEESLENELARAERENQPVAIIMLDADHFKRINDVHGHKAGDLALQALAHIIQLYIRKSDIACRYGGEEFVIVMPNTGLEVARERAEMIRGDFRQVDFIGPGARTGTSLSIGIAIYPLSGRRGDEVLDAADQAMYAAKMEGGNRIKQALPVKKKDIPVEPPAPPVPKNKPE